MPTPGTENLTFERHGATAVVTMNRPEAKNALSLPMLVGMADAWEEIDGNDEIRCAVLTGAGGTFCSGMDLKAMASPEAEQYRHRQEADPDLHWKALLRHYQLRKPLIAAVEGWAVAGGTEILQATDIRVGGREREIRGLRGAPWALSRWAARPCASGGRSPSPWPWTCCSRPARSAPRRPRRSVSSVASSPTAEALDEALRIAEVICGNGPLAVEAIKRSVRETEGIPEVEALKIELEIGWPIFATEDAKEGQKAFAEKRTPEYKRR